MSNLAESSVMGNTLEAIIGAVYLDGGWRAASRLAVSLTEDITAQAAHQPGGRDWKSLLQEHLGKNKGKRPHYSSVQQGTSTQPRFRVTVSVDGEELGQGEGKSKKLAAQRAARAALSDLGQ